jgi:hypothetical protein
LENLKGRAYLIDISVDGRIIKRVLREIGYECVDLIYLGQERIQYRDLVNTVMNLPFP